MTSLRLNPKLDPEPFARLYAERRFVQVPALFEPDVADWLAAAIASLPWRLILQNDAGENLLLTREQLSGLSAEERRVLDAGQRQRAARNLGYTYLTYPMIQAALEGWDPGHPIHALTQFLNSPPFMRFARAIIRFPGLTRIDAHASTYRAGDYLTRHVDDGQKKERRAAYTIGFSRHWQPDWGGLLAFLDDSGDVKRGWLPRFNLLTVFDGLQLHAVTQVSDFAPHERLSVAGWFRDDPLPPRAR